MTAKHSLLSAFLLMLLPPLAVAGLLFILSGTALSPALYLILLWGLFLPACALPSFFAGRMGLHPFACILPGSALLLLPLFGAVGAGLCGAVIGLVGCVAGRETLSQQTRSRRHHGKK